MTDRSKAEEKKNQQAVAVLGFIYGCTTAIVTAMGAAGAPPLNRETMMGGAVRLLGESYVDALKQFPIEGGIKTPGSQDNKQRAITVHQGSPVRGVPGLPPINPVPDPPKCGTCDGTGYIAPSDPRLQGKPCPECDGVGVAPGDRSPNAPACR